MKTFIQDAHDRLGLLFSFEELQTLIAALAAYPEHFLSGNTGKDIDVPLALLTGKITRRSSLARRMLLQRIPIMTRAEKTDLWNIMNHFLHGEPKTRQRPVKVKVTGHPSLEEAS